jgi:hypothetical protein
VPSAIPSIVLDRSSGAGKAAEPIIKVRIRGKLQQPARWARSAAAAKVGVVEVGGNLPCTITRGDAVQKVRAVVTDLRTQSSSAPEPRS